MLKYYVKKGRRISFMNGSPKYLARFHRVFASFPFLTLSNFEDWNITTKDIKGKNLYFQFVQSQLNNSACSILSQSLSSSDKSGNGSMSKQMWPAWPVCHCNSISESPGSLFQLTSHCRRLPLKKYTELCTRWPGTAAPHGSPFKSEPLWRCSEVTACPEIL